MAAWLHIFLMSAVRVAITCAVLEIKYKENIFQVSENTKNLIAVPVKSMVTQSKLQCLHRCKLHTGCQDINYNLITKECELLGQTIENKKKENEKKSDWVSASHFTETLCRFPNAKSANKGICPSFYLQGPRTIVVNKQFAKFPLWSPSWIVSFKIRPYKTVGPISNVLAITVGGGNINTYGFRNPAVFFLSGSTVLHITSAVNGNPNFVFDTDPLPLHVYTRIELTQLYERSGQYRYTIKVNGNLLFSAINQQARQFNNVKLFSGDPWHSRAPAYMKDFLVMNYL